MSIQRFPASWLLSAVGCGLLLSAVLWQPPFQRELTVTGFVLLLLALGSFLKRLERR